MTHLVVHEWGRVAVHNMAGEAPAGAFTRAQADAMITAARAHPLASLDATNIIADHHTYLAVRQMVGVIAAPGCSLEILPKLDPLDGEENPTIRRRLMRMLDVALGLGIGLGEASAMGRQNESLLDILIRLFADRLVAETRRGLPRGYLAQAEDLPALRGRLDLARQFTAHAVRPDRLACRFDALSPDLALMQVMKACVVFLARHARAGETRRRLNELRFVLADISDVPASSLPWEAVRINRTNRRWEALFALARLFLKREWQGTHHDLRAGAGITLLFPMNDLFEAYIAALMARTLRSTEFTVHAQGGRQFCLTEEGEGGARRFQTKPDLMIRHRGQTVMVIDTKWKRIGANPEDAKYGVHQADVYQMMAYGQIYQCQNLVLLYPHHFTLGPGTLMHGYRITGQQGRLLLATCDLRMSESIIIAQLLDIVQSADFQISANPNATAGFNGAHP